MTDSLPEALLPGRHRDSFYFVQIGANDGVSHDPIRPLIQKYNWRGLMIEPQAGPYSKLNALYAGNDRIKTVQKAVARHYGYIKLYRHMGEGYSIDNFTGGASVLLRDDPQFNAEEYSEVRCDTADSIFEAAGVPYVIDLLAIDTEGYDSDIIDQIDFDKYTIRNIFFEKWPYQQGSYSSTQIVEQEQALKKLRDYKYHLIDLGNNYLAYKRRVQDEDTDS